jgi:hypothetical protein
MVLPEGIQDNVSTPPIILCATITLTAQLTSAIKIPLPVVPILLITPRAMMAILAPLTFAINWAVLVPDVPILPKIPIVLLWSLVPLEIAPPMVPTRPLEDALSLSTIQFAMMDFPAPPIPAIPVQLVQMPQLDAWIPLMTYFAMITFFAPLIPALPMLSSFPIALRNSTIPVPLLDAWILPTMLCATTILLAQLNAAILATVTQLLVAMCPTPSFAKVAVALEVVKKCALEISRSILLALAISLNLIPHHAIFPLIRTMQDVQLNSQPISFVIQ